MSPNLLEAHIRDVVAHNIDNGTMTIPIGTDAGSQSNGFF